MTESQKYALYLDMLRQHNKFTVEQFCSDIVDERTFRRYKTGEKTISYTKIAAFCDRLRINPADFFYSAKHNDEFEHKQIVHLFNLMRNRDFKAYTEALEKIDIDYIFNIQNRRFYDLTVAYADYELKKRSDEDIYQSLAQIADYPNCLKFKAFDHVSVAAILKISEIEYKQKKEDAFQLMMEILTDPSMLIASAENHRVIPTIYADVCITMMRQKRFKAANYIAQNGINYALKHHDYIQLSYLYYTKAYSLFKLGDQENAELNAVLCLSSAVSIQDDFEIELFYRVLRKDFEIDPYEFFEKHMHDMLKQIKKVDT